jgi:hypothetical protein
MHSRTLLVSPNSLTERFDGHFQYARVGLLMILSLDHSTQDVSGAYFGKTSPTPEREESD